MPEHLQTSLYLGIDAGTSGIRAVVMDQEGNQVLSDARPLPPSHKGLNSHEQDPELWWSVLDTLLSKICARVDSRQIRAIAIDATSSTLLLTDRDGKPLGPALMYNDSRSQSEAEQIAGVAPETGGAQGPSSALAKLLYLCKQDHDRTPAHALHQADWLSGRLSGRYGVSDENNCLKLGYDPVARNWPRWLHDLDFDKTLLPDVLVPGTPVAPVTEEMAQRFGLAGDTRIVAGTTDGVAAFLATGACRIGDAVTSLGSTLILKILSDQPIFDARYGIYSHRIGDQWLVGGASNCGGTTLLQFFTPEEMEQLTPELEPENPTGLNYYPLPTRGERFPVNDPFREPRIIPRPAQRAVFFQGLLEGIAAVEQQGYELLASLGAPHPQTLRSIGKGAENEAWTLIRQRLLKVSMLRADGLQAAGGAALLARKGAANRP